MKQNGETLNPEALAEVIVSAVVAFVAYYMVQGSDPGYISEEVRERTERHGEEYVYVTRRVSSRRATHATTNDDSTILPSHR